MTVREKSQKSMRCREYARPGRPLSPALSLDPVAAFRYYRRQFFKPRHTVRHFRSTGPYRASGEKRQRPCYARRRGCHASPPQIAPPRIFGDATLAARKTYRRVASRSSQILKKRKTKEKNPTLRQEKMRMSGGDGRISPSFGADA